MRALFFVTGTALLALVAAPLSAETLREALVKAYNTNPTLAAQRASQRGVDENVPIIRSQGLPGVQLQSTYTENVVKAANSFVSPDRQAGASVTLAVPIYSGGAVRNGIRAAQTRVESGQQSLRGTEASLFTTVVGAYMDVIRDEAIVGLNTQNVRVLEVNLQASRDRFQVGDLTRTDVAQSEARLAVARSQLQSSQAQLITSRESYIRFVGTEPGRLDTPPDLPNLPAEPDVAVDVALKNNPTLLAAAKARDAAGYDIGVARANRLPTVAVNVGGNYYNYLGSLGSGTGVAVRQSGKAATVGLGLTMPLYQGGRPAAQIRQAQDARVRAIEQVTETERGVIAQARSAYAVWKSSLETIASSEVAVNANKLSLEGVRAENSVGNRTILDILNAEQELLNSQVTLVTAQRDAYVAGFALLAAMGEAEARNLGLDGGPLYDPVAHYTSVRHRIWDWSSDPDPAVTGTRTNATRPQTAKMTQPLDPILEAPVDRSAPITAGNATKNR
ncbi:TolC family outer membrane protein [Sphingomonas sp. 10B4]|uniref:TolC family outer membrane protein n=1 Tax=Sphingomonas sp. 10B4 TaxID=3048575 RepID=UPI002AB555AC|nr:TolC family outer membrane protein [Sphingomonas sp. 10B4]MDY7525222.1 TolC family outer membrane protein [Sphingomonas sp. 10B4]MEB0282046.1 TolC family outer membrane protein [Sphingomonas sp. 10B4]